MSDDEKDPNVTEAAGETGTKADAAGKGGDGDGAMGGDSAKAGAAADASKWPSPCPGVTKTLDKAGDRRQDHGMPRQHGIGAARRWRSSQRPICSASPGKECRPVTVDCVRSVDEIGGEQRGREHPSSNRRQALP